MLICPECRHPLAAHLPVCISCGFAPEVLDGFVAWAPDLAKNYEGFPPESFAGLAAVEAENFWFRARNQLIVWALGKYFPEFRSLLEVGCGTGFVLSGIARHFSGARLVGSEIFTAGLVHAAQRLPGVELIQMDARRLPYDAEFDVVAAFDVIEHIKEDERVLANLYRATRPGGGCLITVPQHRWLWSAVDEAACHERRYTAEEVHRKIRSAGFRILMSTSFVTLLLPAMLFSRLVGNRSGRADSEDELRLPSVVNRLFMSIMNLEAAGIRAGMRWPLGGSRLVVAIRDKA
jgi:SAM-dependent methyltransferase